MTTKSQLSKSMDEHNSEQQSIDESTEQDTSKGIQRLRVSKNSQKFESADDTTISETNSSLMKKKRTFTKRVANVAQTGAAGANPNASNNNHQENPVENIRKQLEKLEDLGDQLPSNESAYTVRYPFQDKGDY